MNCPLKTAGHADHHLEQFIDDFDLVQHIHEPTHKRDDLFDVVIIAPWNPQATNMCVEDMGFSDHFVVITTIWGIEIPSGNCNFRGILRPLTSISFGPGCSCLMSTINQSLVRTSSPFSSELV